MLAQCQVSCPKDFYHPIWSAYLCLSGRELVKNFSHISPGEKSPVSSASNIRDTPYSFNREVICRLFHKSCSNVPQTQKGAAWHHRPLETQTWETLFWRSEHVNVKWVKGGFLTARHEVISWVGTALVSLRHVSTRRSFFPWALCEHLAAVLVPLLINET